MPERLLKRDATYYFRARATRYFRVRRACSGEAGGVLVHGYTQAGWLMARSRAFAPAPAAF